MVTLILNEDYDDYNQIMQETDLSFSMADKRDDDLFKEIVSPFTCREFFGCLILATYLCDELEEFYGMCAKPIAIYDGYMYMVLHTEISKSMEMCLSSKNLIHSLEDKIGINKFEILEVDSTTTIIKFDEYWAKSPLLLQAYSYIFRLFCYENVSISGDYQHYDTLDKLIDIKASEYYNGDSTSDNNIARELSKSKVSLTKLLLNSREIFKTNPLTGIDDDFYLSEVVSHLDGDNSFIRRENNNSVYLNRGHIHSMSGLISFADNLWLIDSYRGYGYSWGLEYLKIT